MKKKNSIKKKHIRYFRYLLRINPNKQSDFLNTPQCIINHYNKGYWLP